MESVDSNKNESRQEAIAAAALSFVGELLKANLLIPQTYAAIRVLGAKSILVETSTEYDFSPNDLLEQIDEYYDDIVDHFTNQMHIAHHASNVTIRNFDPHNVQEVERRVSETIGYHINIAITATAHLLEFVCDNFNEADVGKVQELAKQVVQIVYDALYDKRLREAIRTYREKVAKQRHNKIQFAQTLNQEWLTLFIEKLSNSALKPATPDGMQNFKALFVKITNPSEEMYSDTPDGTGV